MQQAVDVGDGDGDVVVVVVDEYQAVNQFWRELAVALYRKPPSLLVAALTWRNPAGAAVDSAAAVGGGVDGGARLAFAGWLGLRGRISGVAWKIGGASALVRAWPAGE